MTKAKDSSRWGLASILACYVIWGFFPLYWIPLMAHPPDQLLAHRIVWGAACALLALVAFGQLKELRRAMGSRRVWLVFFVCALVLAINWLTYLLAITRHQVLQASLGYFIAPLVSLFCARVFLGERFTRAQGIAIALAAIGVAWLAILGGELPWLALTIAVSWGVYGLLRKLAPLPALLGFSMETFMLLPFALGYLAWCQAQGTLVFAQLAPLPLVLLLGSGLITMVPLLFFAAGARRVQLSTVGVLQYLTPTLQFLLGLWVFHEPFDTQRFIGYLWVWAGVALFVFSRVRMQMTTRHANG